MSPGPGLKTTSDYNLQHTENIHNWKIISWDHVTKLGAKCTFFIICPLAVIIKNENMYNYQSELSKLNEQSTIIAEVLGPFPLISSSSKLVQ